MYFLSNSRIIIYSYCCFLLFKNYKIIYFDEEKEKYDTDHSIWLKFSLTFSTILILLYFIFPSQLLKWYQELILFNEIKKFNLKKLKAQITQLLELSKIQIINMVWCMQKHQKREKDNMEKNGFL